MKKLFVTATVIGSLISSFAQAENKNQFSISLIDSKVENDYKTTGTPVPHNFDSKSDALSFAIGYGYKVELPKKFFVTPGLFYDNINNLAKEATLPTYKEKVKYRYGAKVDLGYNLLDNLSTYGSLGYARDAYEIQFSNVGRKTGNDSSFVYGAGLSYDITKNIFVAAEYNFQSIDLKYSNTESYDSDIEIFKLSAGYQF